MITSLRRRISLSKWTSASTVFAVAGLMGIIAALLIAPVAFAAPPPPRRDAQRLKDELDRQARDRLRQTEQQHRAEQARRDDQDRAQKQAAQDYARTHPQPTFSAAKAPPPDDCLKFFLLAARSAISMEQIMPYLPEGEQKALRTQQASFNLQGVAERREYYRQQNPSLTEEQLANLTKSPYEVALLSNRSFAHQIMDILDVKVVGDQAEVSVATNSGSINGKAVPNGKAYIEMVGEGSTWKVKTNGSSALVHKQQLTNP